MIVLATHVTLNTKGNENYGPFHNVENFLNKRKLNYLVQKEILSTNLINIIQKIWRICKIIFQNKEIKIFIGFDPVNAFAGIIGKFIFRRNFKVVFYSIDYSTNRMGNFLLNQIYIYLDKFCTIFSEESWSCSYKVYEMRNKFKKVSNYFVPNIPNIDNPHHNKFQNFTLVFTGYFSKVYRIDLLIELINEIKNKKLDIDLYVVGDGIEINKITDVIKKNNLEERVFLKGYLSHSEVIDLLSKSHAGLALYSGSESYDEYRDSMKIREFIFLEIPTISTNKIPNAQEVINHNLGKVVSNTKQIIEAIELYKDKKNYQEVIKNCVEYNKKFNIIKIYEARIVNNF